MIKQAIPPFRPHPHARKKLDITLEQLESLKTAIDHDCGFVLARDGIRRALVNRGLAAYSPRNHRGERNCVVGQHGRDLIAKYRALKDVLTERSK